MNKKISCENNRTCEKANYQGTATFFLMGSYNNRFAPININSATEITSKKVQPNTNRVNGFSCSTDTKQKKLSIRHHPTPWRMPYNHYRKKYTCPPDDKGFTKPDGTISDISNCYNEKIIKDIPNVCEDGKPICTRPIYTTARLVGKTGLRLQNNGGNYNNYLQSSGKLYNQNAFGILPENKVESKVNLYKIGTVNGINETDLSSCKVSYKVANSLTSFKYEKQKIATATRKWANPGFNSRTSVSSRNRLQRLKYNTVLGGQQTRNGYNNCVNGEICSLYQSPGDNSKASTNPRLFSLCPPRRNCSASRVNGMKQSCPAGPTFNIQFNSSSVDEGESFSFTVQTTNWRGNNLYYTLSGTGITVDDLISNQLTGQYTVRGNDQPSTFINITAMDYFTEGTETITVQLFSDASRTQLEASDTIVINDTTITPTYSIGFSSPDTDEGDSFTITVQTTPFSPGLNLYYSLTGISAEDLTGNLSGSGIIDALGQMSITNTIVEDVTTEGPETLTFNLFRDAAMTTQVATSSMTINDTSIYPTYSIAFDGASYEEGDSFIVTVTTTGISDGTMLYYDYTGISAADISTNTVLTGDGTINSNTFTFTETLFNDVTTEGTETITVRLFTDAARTNQVATSSATINDTSTSAPALTATFRLVSTEFFGSETLVYGRLAFNNALDTSSWNVPTSAFEIWNQPMQIESAWNGTATTTDPSYNPFDISNCSHIEDGSSNSILGVARTNVIYFQWGASTIDGCLGAPVGSPGPYDPVPSSASGNMGYFMYIKPSSGPVIKDIYGQEWAGPGYSNLSGMRTGMQFGYTGAMDYTLDMGYYELPTYYQGVYGW